MIEKRYYAHKHLFQKNKVHDKICHKFMNIDKTVEHMNNQYWKYKQLKEENEQLKSENIELTVDNKELKCTNNELYQENEQLKQEVENIKDVNVRCCNDYSHYRRENEQLKHDATVLIQANQDYRKENEQLKDALNQRTEQCDKYYEENEQLKQQIKIFEKFLEVNDLDIDWVEFCGVDECAFENPDFSCQECIHLKGDVE